MTTGLICRNSDRRAGWKPTIGRRVNRTLDDSVRALHVGCREREIVPHAAVWGLTLAVLPIVGVLLSLAVGTPAWVAPTAILGALATYLAVYMPIKRRMIPGARRKLLIDLALFVGPVFFGLASSMGVNPSEINLVFLVMILCGVLMLRLGCFVGGCCHGRPGRIGVHYPGTGHRVIPLPLLEAAFALLLLVGVIVSASVQAPSRTVVVAAGLAYVGYRFVAEFFRARAGDFAVRRCAGLSLTQWLCLLIASAAAVVVSGL